MWRPTARFVSAEASWARSEKAGSRAICDHPDHKTIAAFYTLSQYAVDLGELREDISKKMPKYPMVSATLLGRLGVSERFRGQGLGERLLMDALHRALQSSEQIASAGVVVDTKDDQAVAFYRKYGFIDLPKIERLLFLPMV